MCLLSSIIPLLLCFFKNICHCNVLTTAMQAKFFKHSSIYSVKHVFAGVTLTVDLVIMGLVNMQCTTLSLQKLWLLQTSHSLLVICREMQFVQGTFSCSQMEHLKLTTQTSDLYHHLLIGTYRKQHCSANSKQRIAINGKGNEFKMDVPDLYPDQLHTLH